MLKTLMRSNACPSVRRACLLVCPLVVSCGVEPAPPPREPIPLPMVVSDYFSPDGFWGDGEKRGAVDLQRECADRVEGAQGDCYHIIYTPGAKRFAGINWQYPHNNWGFASGRKVEAGATRITLWARGRKGGERVGFGAGQPDAANGFGDSFSLSQVSVELTREWKQYELPFLGETYAGMADVIGAFVLSLPAGDTDEPVAIYLDDVKWQ